MFLIGLRGPMISALATESSANPNYNTLVLHCTYVLYCIVCTLCTCVCTVHTTTPVSLASPSHPGPKRRCPEDFPIRLGSHHAQRSFQLLIRPELRSTSTSGSRGRLLFDRVVKMPPPKRRRIASSDLSSQHHSDDRANLFSDAVECEITAEATGCFACESTGFTAAAPVIQPHDPTVRELQPTRSLPHSLTPLARPPPGATPDRLQPFQHRERRRPLLAMPRPV